MEWWKVSKFDRLALAISCFCHYSLFWFGKFMWSKKYVFTNWNITWRLSLLNQSKGFYFNVSQFSIWLILLMVGIVGIVRFHRKFLKAKKLSKEVVVLVKAENNHGGLITLRIFLCSWFLFFSVDPTVPKDVLIFFFSDGADYMGLYCKWNVFRESRLEYTTFTNLFLLSIIKT